MEISLFLTFFLVSAELTAPVDANFFIFGNVGAHSRPLASCRYKKKVKFCEQSIVLNAKSFDGKIIGFVIIDFYYEPETFIGGPSGGRFPLYKIDGNDIWKIKVVRDPNCDRSLDFSQKGWSCGPNSHTKLFDWDLVDSAPISPAEGKILPCYRLVDEEWEKLE